MDSIFAVNMVFQRLKLRCGAFFIFWHSAASSLRKNRVFCISSPILLHHILGEKKVKCFKEKIDSHTLSVPLQNAQRSSLNCLEFFFNSSILDNDISQISFFKEFLADRPQWLMRRK
jgi:hypothetical protein